MRAPLGLLLGLVLALGSVGCGPTNTGPGGDDDGIRDSGADRPLGTCAAGDTQCEPGTNAWQQCQDGRWATVTACPQACEPTRGCVQCVPNSTSCSGQDVVACTAEGTPGAVVAHCAGACQSGHCADPCGQAEETKSYLGCDYWPTVTMNTQLNVAAGFSFAVAVANASSAQATITIEGGALTAPKTETVAAGQLTTIKLPWVETLRQQFAGGAQTEKSVLVPNGAYHLTSTLPITVYQFSALEYKIPTTVSCSDPTCNILGGVDGCENNVCVKFSYSNDASLLLPRHVLGDSATGRSTYLVMARATMELSTGGPKMWSPGFFAVVGTEDGTAVTATFTAKTIAGSGQLTAYTVGQTANFNIDKGTVLMIASDHNDQCPTVQDPQCPANGSFCDLSMGYDLTGTEITSDKPIAVYGGHNCTFVPYNKWACDHLEEQLVPVTAWGKAYVATRAVSTTDPNLWRVLSAGDGNAIQFNPPLNDRLTGGAVAAITLNKGQWQEFITDQDFEVGGSDAFMVAGFMVGQNYTSCQPSTGAPGDPAFALAVPTEQFRKSYVFLAPESYQQNYVNVVAKTGATILLDGVQVGNFTPVGSGEWSVSKLQIAGGTHEIETSDADGFGIQVYGVGSYTSYMYPGGLDVKQIYVPG